MSKVYRVTHTQTLSENGQIHTHLMTGLNQRVREKTSLSTHLDVLMFCWLAKLVLKIAAKLTGLTFCFWQMKRKSASCPVVAVSPCFAIECVVSNKQTGNQKKKFTHHFAGAVFVLCFNCIRWCWCCWCRWHVTRWHLYFSLSLAPLLS